MRVLEVVGGGGERTLETTIVCVVGLTVGGVVSTAAFTGEHGLAKSSHSRATACA